MKKLYSLVTLCVFAFLFFASNSVKHLSKDANTYADVSKPESKDTTLFYTLPTIMPIEKTTQEQTKGGITITCQIEPFAVAQSTVSSSTPFYADPSKPGYDVIQTIQTPRYDVKPNNLTFNLKIKNHAERMLKMRDVALVLLTDGIEYKLPKEYMDDEWQVGNVMSSFSKDFSIPGPSIPELKDGRSIEIFINDVPISYDQAGNVTKRENFRWTFMVKTKTESKGFKIGYTYDYQPVHKERCVSCNGTGQVRGVCQGCKGTGRIRGLDGNPIICATCNGTGQASFKCTNCNGFGSIAYPKSKRPPVTSSVHWSGYWVTVNTKPEGANIQIMDPDKGTYVYVNKTSNCQVQWYKSPTQQYPIIVDYNGKKAKVLPYKNGKESSKVQIDFTTSEPTIKIGQDAP